MQYDKYVALDILNRVHISIEHIEERSQPYHCGDDFLMSSTGVAMLRDIIAHYYFLQFCISKKINGCLKESLSNELRNGD